MSVSMRYTKLKAEEAALIAGEVTKPTWESRNEGIHERVSFEDTLWGFDLAGGSYYKTPLRVTYVKPDSRAEKAGIRPGDRLLRINGIDTSTLTIQQAHDLILESGIHIQLSVTSPDDLEDAYYAYEDPIVEDFDEEEARRLEEEKARKRRVHAKVSSFWSLQWPWVSRRKIIYRESNCFMVPSKYEEQRRDKYPIRPALRYFDDIILYNDEDKSIVNSRQPSKRGVKVTENDMNGDSDDCEDDEDVSKIVDEVDDSLEGDVKTEDSLKDGITNHSEMNDSVISPENNGDKASNLEDIDTKIEGLDTSDEKVKDTSAMESEGVPEDTLANGVEANDANDDTVINEVLGKSDSSRMDEDNILDSILSDEGQNLENSESMNER